MRPTPAQSGQIEVIDGDTVRFKGVAYRLVGIDTPERGDKAPRDVNADALMLPRACAPSLAGVMPGSFGWRAPAAQDRRAREIVILGACVDRY